MMSQGTGTADPAKTIDVRGYRIPAGERTCIMGVLNITPDSFSDGGRYSDHGSAVEQAVRMVKAGADIIDIGGESSRPGAAKISAQEEIDRVMPVILELEGLVKVPLSIDTYKSEVAKEALSHGVAIVNDITALTYDPDMAKVVSEFDAGIVLMHMKGMPFNMQDDPSYDDLIGDIMVYLNGSINSAVQAGIDPSKIIIDPGIGFGKTLEHNLTILKHLERFKALGKHILIGVSRKSFIGSITGKNTDERVFGTAASVSWSILSGANIIRVHDVPAMRDVARIIDAIKGV